MTTAAHPHTDDHGETALVAFRFPKALVPKLDALAKRDGRSRSGLLAKLSIDLLESETLNGHGAAPAEQPAQPVAG